jgi:ribosomal protein L37AE/L43A
MPKREDEFWASQKEGKGQGLCPRCGSSNISYNPKFHSWRCNKCEHSFPTPSYGSGKDLRGKTTKPIYKHKKYKTTGIRFKSVGRSLSVFWRNLKKVLISILVLATTAIVVSAVCLFISGEIKLSSTIIIVIVGLIILAWGLRSLSKYRPSVARTFIFLLVSVLFIITTSVYLDVKSPADVKDSIIGAFSTETEQFRSTVDLVIQRTELKVVEISAVISENDGETKQAMEQSSEASADIKHVQIDGGILVGADGHYISLQNNPDATNHSWGELKEFLLKDSTDSKSYDFDTFVCADFAEMLHNNAEAAGIRAAFVSIFLGPCSYWPSSGGHALNAFETTDRGLVYIDCTGGNGGINADKIVELEVGKNYIPECIFPEPGWSPIWGNMGMVEEIEVVQW